MNFFVGASETDTEPEITLHVHHAAVTSNREVLRTADHPEALLGSKEARGWKPSWNGGTVSFDDGAATRGTDDDSILGADLPFSPRALMRRIVVKAPTKRFSLLAQWKGVVLEVREESFVARIADVDGAYPDEESEFFLADVSPAELDLVQPGAGFYWTLGYQTRSSGQRIRASLLRFQQPRAWSTSEIENAREWARSVIVDLDGD